MTPGGGPGQVSSGLRALVTGGASGLGVGTVPAVDGGMGDLWLRAPGT